LPLRAILTDRVRSPSAGIFVGERALPLRARSGKTS